MATTGQILLVLENRFSHCNYRFQGLTYSDLEWFDTTISKPSEIDIENLYTEVVNEIHTNAYRGLRRESYPKIDELIVALWEKLVEDDGLTSSTIADIQQRRLQVKAAIPQNVGTRKNESI